MPFNSPRCPGEKRRQVGEIRPCRKDKTRSENIYTLSEAKEEKRNRRKVVVGESSWFGRRIRRATPREIALNLLNSATPGKKKEEGRESSVAID